jgi:heme oxygenase
MALIDQLREKTQDLHEKLHVHPLLAMLQQDHITHEDYIFILQAFYLAYATSEAGRAELHTTMPDAPTLTWLKEDLDAQGVKPLEADAVHYPAITSLSQLVGYLYVKQGSTLGGRVISKHLAKTLGLEEGKTNHFFAGYGDETGPQWKAFLAQLEQPGVNADEAVAQAVLTFELIRHCCDAVLAHKMARTSNYSAVG